MINKKIAIVFSLLISGIVYNSNQCMDNSIPPFSQKNKQYGANSMNLQKMLAIKAAINDAAAAKNILVKDIYFPVAPSTTLVIDLGNDLTGIDRSFFESNSFVNNLLLKFGKLNLNSIGISNIKFLSPKAEALLIEYR